jgi:hypothetical protein
VRATLSSGTAGKPWQPQLRQQAHWWDAFMLNGALMASVGQSVASNLNLSRNNTETRVSVLRKG